MIEPSLYRQCLTINRFMGADVRYFEGFSEYFPDGHELNISTNYRSGKRIVEASNAFMAAQGFRGVPAIAAASFPGKIEINDVRNINLWATDQYDPEGKDRKIKDLFSSPENPDPLIAFYMKRIIEILEEECNVNENVLILSRISKVRRKYKLDELERKLKELLLHSYGYSDKRLDKIEFKTIHKAKGMEADTVILLEANSGRLPLLHPDHDLYRIFDETAQTALEDEDRLFYVAITRPKKSLFILHDDNPSGYLQILRGTGFVGA